MFMATQLKQQPIASLSCSRKSRSPTPTPLEPSLAGKIDGTHAKKEKTAPKGERRMYLLLGQGPDSRGARRPDLQL